MFMSDHAHTNMRPHPETYFGQPDLEHPVNYIMYNYMMYKTLTIANTCSLSASHICFGEAKRSTIIAENDIQQLYMM